MEYIEVQANNTQKTISLGKSDFVAAGGQGEVYSKGDVAFKIYTDPNGMIPVAKIKELSALSLPGIIKPTNLLLDKKTKSPVGYTMRFLRDTFVLCQLFTKTFCDKYHVDNKKMIGLIGKLKEVYQHAHSKKILIVDGNEMNFLVPDSLDEIYAIDIDNWETPSFKASMIMDSIRDRHLGNSTKFTEGTDWFSFGIVACRMLMKIHPYKGTHPNGGSLDERMLRNQSIFNKDVTIPGMCPSFNVIPQNYRDWFKAIFEEGKRIPPPDALQAVIAIVTKQAVRGGQHFNVHEIEEFAETIVRHCICPNGMRVMVTTTGHYLGKKKDSDVIANPAIGSEASGSVIIASVKDRKLRLRNLSWFQDIDHSLSADQVMDYEGTIYLKNKESIFELLVVEMGNRTQVSIKKVADVLENATSMYDGVVIQNLLGTHYATIFPKRGRSHNIRLKEMDKHKIFDAKYDNGVLMVAAATKKGEYEKFIFRFDENFSEYDLRIEKCNQVPTMNFVVVHSRPGHAVGICAHKTDDEKIELFRGVKDGGQAYVFDEPAVNGDIRLFKIGKQVLFSRDNRLYSIEKKP